MKDRKYHMIFIAWIVFSFLFVLVTHFSKPLGNSFPGWDEFKFLIKSEYIKENGFFAIFDAYERLPDFIVEEDISPMKPPLSPLYYAFLRLFGFSPKSFFWRFFNIVPVFLAFTFYFVFLSKHFGNKTALLATILFSSCPVVLAQSQLIHSDNLLLFFSIIGSCCLVHIWKLKALLPKHSIVFSIVFSMWVLTKYQALIFLFFFFIFFLSRRVFFKKKFVFSIPFIICFLVFVFWSVFSYSNLSSPYVSKSGFLSYVRGSDNPVFFFPKAKTLFFDLFFISFGPLQFLLIFPIVFFYRRDFKALAPILCFFLFFLVIFLLQYQNRFFVPAYGILFLSQAKFIEKFIKKRKLFVPRIKIPWVWVFVVLFLFSSSISFYRAYRLIFHDWILPSGYYLFSMSALENKERMGKLLIPENPDAFYYYIRDEIEILTPSSLSGVEGVDDLVDKLFLSNVTHIVVNRNLCSGKNELTHPCFFVGPLLEEGVLGYLGYVGFLDLFVLHARGV